MQRVFGRKVWSNEATGKKMGKSKVELKGCDIAPRMTKEKRLNIYATMQRKGDCVHMDLQ